MMFKTEGNLQSLSEGVRLKSRVQHPRVQECRDRGTPYWFVRYREDRLLSDGSVRTTRKRTILGPSKGPDAISRKQAELERDQLLTGINAVPSSYAKSESNPRSDVGAIPFGELAAVWRTDFVERKIGAKALIAASTRAKYLNHLENHILPRWHNVPIGEFRAKAIIDWLQDECTSWYMMADLRNIMSGIFTKAQEWEILPDTFANPMSRVKLPKKWAVREKRILTEEQAARVLARLEDPYLLICETCADTGTRISEVTALRIRNVNLEQDASGSNNETGVAI
jgi:hypothetical protein